VKKHNSFHHKRNGRTKRVGTVTFSSERGNLTNKNTFAASGLANTRAISIESTRKSLRLAVKSRKNAFKPKSSYTTFSLSDNTDESALTILKNTINRHYRADLRKAALARYSHLNRSMKQKRSAKQNEKRKNNKTA